MRKILNREDVTRGYGISLTGKDVAILKYLGALLGLKTKSEVVQHIIRQAYTTTMSELDKTNLKINLPKS